MIDIMCKYWQVSNATEFGKIFRIPYPEKVFTGEQQLEPHKLAEVMEIMSQAKLLEANGSAIDALRQYQTDSGYSISQISKRLGLTSQVMNRWLRNERSPSRTAILKIAAGVRPRNLKAEWSLTMKQLDSSFHTLGLSRKHMVAAIGAPEIYSTYWFRHSGQNRPNREMLEPLCDWCDDLAMLLAKVEKHYDNAPQYKKLKGGRPSKADEGGE